MAVPIKDIARKNGATLREKSRIAIERAIKKWITPLTNMHVGLSPIKAARSALLFRSSAIFSLRKSLQKWRIFSASMATASLSVTATQTKSWNAKQYTSFWEKW